jgi:hypothetical protein
MPLVVTESHAVGSYDSQATVIYNLLSLFEESTAQLPLFKVKGHVALRLLSAARVILIQNDQIVCVMPELGMLMGRALARPALRSTIRA